jgi:hypothetical protein
MFFLTFFDPSNTDAWGLYSKAFLGLELLLYLKFVSVQNPREHIAVFCRFAEKPKHHIHPGLWSVCTCLFIVDAVKRVLELHMRPFSRIFRSYIEHLWFCE